MQSGSSARAKRPLSRLGSVFVIPNPGRNGGMANYTLTALYRDRLSPKRKIGSREATRKTSPPPPPLRSVFQAASAAHTDHVMAEIAPSASWKIWS